MNCLCLLLCWMMFRAYLTSIFFISMVMHDCIFVCKLFLFILSFPPSFILFSSTSFAFSFVRSFVRSSTLLCSWLFNKAFTNHISYFLGHQILSSFIHSFSYLQVQNSVLQFFYLANEQHTLCILIFDSPRPLPPLPVIAPLFPYPRLARKL